jgi:hypothetical protein
LGERPTTGESRNTPESGRQLGRRHLGFERTRSRGRALRARQSGWPVSMLTK